MSAFARDSFRYPHRHPGSGFILTFREIQRSPRYALAPEIRGFVRINHRAICQSDRFVDRRDRGL